MSGLGGAIILAMTSDGKSKAAGCLLRTVFIGAAVGVAFGWYAFPVFERTFGWGPSNASPWEGIVILLYVLFLFPVMWLPYPFEDIQVLLHSLAGIFWALPPFGVWWLCGRGKRRRK